MSELIAEVNKEQFFLPLTYKNVLCSLFCEEKLLDASFVRRFVERGFTKYWRF